MPAKNESAQEHRPTFRRVFVTRCGITIKVTVNRFGVNSCLTDAEGRWQSNSTRKTRHEAVRTLFELYREQLAAENKPVQLKMFA